MSLNLYISFTICYPHEVEPITSIVQNGREYVSFQKGFLYISISKTLVPSLHICLGFWWMSITNVRCERRPQHIYPQGADKSQLKGINQQCNYP